MFTNKLSFVHLFVSLCDIEKMWSNLTVTNRYSNQMSLHMLSLFLCCMGEITEWLYSLYKIYRNLTDSLEKKVP